MDRIVGADAQEDEVGRLGHSLGEVVGHDVASRRAVPSDRAPGDAAFRAASNRASEVTRQPLILRVDTDERKIGLSLKRAQWAKEEEVREEVRAERTAKKGLKGGLEGGESTTGLGDLKIPPR